LSSFWNSAVFLSSRRVLDRSTFSIPVSVAPALKP
jgi:hypothetical protein